MFGHHLFEVATEALHHEVFRGARLAHPRYSGKQIASHEQLQNFVLVVETTAVAARLLLLLNDHEFGIPNIENLKNFTVAALTYAVHDLISMRKLELSIRTFLGTVVTGSLLH